MRLEDVLSGSELAVVALGLTRAEASELRDDLTALLTAQNPSRHEHVASTDYQKEIWVWIQDAE